MKKKKYLPLYWKWINAGELPDNGLCWSLGFREMDLFLPWKTVPNHGPGAYWAYDGEYNDINDVAISFGPLRQNIVLFLAAMNGEL